MKVESCVINEKQLFVGVGSPNGDDIIGWQVARCLERSSRLPFVIKITESPVDILDWIEAYDRLVIIDAFQGERVGKLWRWEWNDRQWAQQRWSGTHDFGLVPTLHLAEELGWLPQQTTIWGVEANYFEKGNEMTSELATKVEHIAAEIEQYYA
jgi:hydrogenase maturation protease